MSRFSLPMVPRLTNRYPTSNPNQRIFTAMASAANSQPEGIVLTPEELIGDKGSGDRGSRISVPGYVLLYAAIGRLSRPTWILATATLHSFVNSPNGNATAVPRWALRATASENSM